MSKILGHNQPVGAHHGLTRRHDTLLAVGCQRYIRGAGVAAVEGPFRLAVADDEDAGSHCLSGFGVCLYLLVLLPSSSSKLRLSGSS